MQRTCLHAALSQGEAPHACGSVPTGLCCAFLVCAHTDYTFKLRCAKQWRDLIGLPFEALRETRSATCPHGRSVSGIRVHREQEDNLLGDLRSRFQAMNTEAGSDFGIVTEAQFLLLAEHLAPVDLAWDEHRLRLLYRSYCPIESSNPLINYNQFVEVSCC